MGNCRSIAASVVVPRPPREHAKPLNTRTSMGLTLAPIVSSLGCKIHKPKRLWAVEPQGKGG